MSVVSILKPEWVDSKSAEKITEETEDWCDDGLANLAGREGRIGAMKDWPHRKSSVVRLVTRPSLREPMQPRLTGLLSTGCARKTGTRTEFRHK